MNKKSYTFRAVVDPPSDIVSAISALNEDNPFSTAPYLNVRKVSRAVPCAIYLELGDRMVAGCFAFLSTGRVNSRLEITSLSNFPDPEIFWPGLFQFCRDRNVSLLNVYTFGSSETNIEWKASRTAHKLRCEYRLDLTTPDLWALMNRRHQRLIKKARINGLQVQSATDPAARQQHIELANLSLDRRRKRGDEVDSRITMNDVNAFLDNGAGGIFQSVREGEVFSSLLVARSSKGGYAQSSGTSEEGRKIGSSHLLFHEVALILKNEGATLFNLGGADEESTGLQEFKLGLGSTQVELESADFYTGSALKKYATKVFAIVKSIPGFPIGI